MQHPPFPQLPPAGIQDCRHIYVLSARENDAALSRLEAMRSSAWRANGFADPPKVRAITTAINSLYWQRQENFEIVKRIGQLLMCWHGTKATTVTNHPGEPA